LTVRGVLFALLAAGCSTAAQPTAPPPPAGALTIADLHASQVAPTCALNNGVCHDGKEYPDLHTVSALIDLVGQPCNLAAATHAAVHDACEPPGDHLVIPSLGLDAEIARVAQSPADAPTGELAQATVALADPSAAPDPTSFAEADDARVVRAAGAAALTFDLGAAGVRALPSAAPGQLTLDLSDALPEARAFLDDRDYPWRDSMVRVGDPNGNGVLGAQLGVSLITPGDPMRSFVVLRLVDESEGELMPRQCRAWDLQATRALGCWIEGLRPTVEGGPGGVQNPFDPIDLDACAFDPGGRGRCTDAPSAGLAAAEQIFTRSCGGSACHVGEAAPALGLDLSTGRARASLVGVASVENPSELRVAPSAPDASWLLCKLDPSCVGRTGALMPAGGAPLAASDLQVIQSWITDGAN
jgi:hypothetical protein